MVKISNILLPITAGIWSAYFANELRQHAVQPETQKQSTSAIRFSSAYSERVNESLCSAGFGMLHHDVWDLAASSGAADIQFGGRKVRMFGWLSWFGKTALAETVVSSGCNIWELAHHFDSKIAKRAGAVIGVMAEESVGVEPADEWFDFAEQANLDAFGFYSATGARVFQGRLEDVANPLIIDTAGTRIRVILDFDANDGEAADLGFVKGKAGARKAHKMFDFLDSSKAYRLAVASQMEEAFQIL